MSRNFELLQRAAKEREAEQIQEAQERAAITPAALIDSEAVLSSEPRLSTDLDDSSQQSLIKLIQRLFLLPGAGKLVVFSAAEQGAGCTWLTTHSARVLASQVTGSVCAVDGNFRSPGLHESFGVTNHHGLTDSLCSSAPIRNFAQRLPGRKNLWLLSSGSLAKNGPELLNCEAMRVRIAELRTEFDYLLVDSSPLNLYTDTLVLGHMSDGVAMVLSANSTRRETVRKVAQELAAANVRLLGAVLNKRTFPIPAKIYDRL